MKVIIQRTTKASVTVDGNNIGEIGHGLVALVGFTEADTQKDVTAIAEKLINLRIFEDEDGKLNRSLMDTNGEVLSVSQFTLYADVKKGRRPSFVSAAHPDKAIQLYDQFNQKLRDFNITVATGKFGAMMDVQLVNHGPVTINIESKDGKIV